MYLAAQRVVSAAGDGGISVYWSSHECEPLSTLPRSLAEMENLSQSRPGRLVLSAPAVSAAEGAPYVASFLDVMGIRDDRIDVLDSIRALDLAVMRAPLGGPEDVFWQFDDRLALQFHVVTSDLIVPPSELRELKNALQGIVGANASTSCDMPLYRAPMSVVVTRSSDAWGHTYEVDASSRRWLESTLCTRLPQKLRIAREVEADFQNKWGAPVQYAESVRALTTLSPDALQTVGEVVVVDGQSGAELWRA